MAKQIIFTYEGKDYTLEYTRRTVQQMEAEGFVGEDVEKRPMTLLPALFAGAFKAHHRFVKQEVIDKIFAAMPDKETLIGKAYIYMSTSDEGETVNTVIMYLDRRIAPEGFEAPEDVDLFHYTLAAANEYLRQTKVSEQNASDSAVEAESWAHGHESYPDRNTDNAKYYSEQAKQVAVNNGFCHMEIREDGHLYLTRTENILQSLNFKINNGRLEVEMS